MSGRLPEESLHSVEVTSTSESCERKKAREDRGLLKLARLARLASGWSRHASAGSIPDEPPRAKGLGLKV